MTYDIEFETLPREALEAIQVFRLQSTVERIYATVPFYRRKLDEAGVAPRDIRSLADLRRLRIIAGDNERAIQALRGAGFTVSQTDVVAVEVDDRPGGLRRILSLLDRAGLNVEYMYAFVRRSGDTAIMIFRFDNLDEAVRVLTEQGVPVVEGARLYAM